jgi:type I site-specific restriction-modification system R (restriction) subunit
MAMKVKSAVKSGILREGDEAALRSSEAKGVLETLTAEITKANPNFFKNQKNMDYFLKLVATTVKKEKGDPADLGIKAKELLLHFNTDALEGVWDPKSQNALFKVFDNAIEELRLAAKNDPETYLKFSSNAEAQNKIIAKALRKAGVEEKNIPAGLQCAMPVL